MLSDRLALLALLLVTSSGFLADTTEAAVALETATRGVLMARASSSGDLPDGQTMVSVYDPTGQSPLTIVWAPYPAPPPPGFHWQHSGRPAVLLDPKTREPLPDEWTGTWVLVRDGHAMPKRQ
jgi:hypothetical protein